MGAQESWRGGDLAAESALAQQPGQLRHVREGAASRERTGAMELLLSGGLALGRTPVEGWGSARSQRLLRAHGGGQAQATRRTKPRAPPRRRERAQARGAIGPRARLLTAGQEQRRSVTELRHRASQDASVHPSTRFCASVNEILCIRQRENEA